MKERGILFQAPMVRAILAKRKKQTRRVVKDQNALAWGDVSPALLKRCPYGVAGDRLWVRETFALAPLRDDPDPDDEDDWSPVYRADGDERPWLTSLGENAEEIPAPWRPSIFMPRWVSRITLDVKAVRIERLHDISEEDAIAEGIDTSVVDPSPRGMTVKPKHYSSARECFADLWREINGAESWDANPWVWVISFEMVEVARG